MSQLSVARAVTCLVLAAMPLGCDGGGGRMRVLTTQVRAGESVVVRFDAPPVAPLRRGDVLLTLVPVGSDDGFVGQRMVIEEGAAEATIVVGDEGTYELRLLDRSPRRLSGVVARSRIKVDRRIALGSEAPAWFW